MAGGTGVQPIVLSEFMTSLAVGALEPSVIHRRVHGSKMVEVDAEVVLALMLDVLALSRLADVEDVGPTTRILAPPLRATPAVRIHRPSPLPALFGFANHNELHEGIDRGERPAGHASTVPRHSCHLRPVRLFGGHPGT